MFINRYLAKLEKRLGGDTIEERWYEAPIYEFVLEKEVTTERVVGNMLVREGNDIVVYEHTDDGWDSFGTAYPMDSGDMAMKSLFGSEAFDEVDVISGVENIEENIIGRVKWKIKVDIASVEIVSVERKEYRDGKEQSERMKNRKESKQKCSLF